MRRCLNNLTRNNDDDVRAFEKRSLSASSSDIDDERSLEFKFTFYSINYSTQSESDDQDTLLCTGSDFIQIGSWKFNLYAIKEQ